MRSLINQYLLKRIIVALLLFSCLFLCKIDLSAQNTGIQQTIKGVIVDVDSESPVFGANVVIENTNPILGSSTDVNGKFKIENVPIGRVNITVSSLGYETKLIPNVEVTSGKEVVIIIEITEAITTLQSVTIAGDRKGEVINEMSLISARTFSVEETKRYAGSLNDPARMVAAFAGVTGDASGYNDIVVRGNSSKGILWRLEGIEIPNPNHFSDEGTTGGPINALNSTMLSNSDFYSGAFAPEYGNAVSGVLDMKLRTGNTDKRETSANINAAGVGVTTEGPFIKDKNNSYLINYRYSTVTLLNSLNLVDYDGIPKYQDGTFKFKFQTKKAGVFTLFGLGGQSGIVQKESNEVGDTVFNISDFNAGLGFVALKHNYLFSDKVYLNTFMSMSGNYSGYAYDELDSLGNMTNNSNNRLSKSTLRFGTTFNYKINNRHKFKTSVIYSQSKYDYFDEYYDAQLNKFVTELKQKGNADLVQSYVNWKYRITGNLTMVTGIHSLYSNVNQEYTIEPRIGVKWDLNELNSFSIGFGRHSKRESLTYSFAQVIDDEGIMSSPNKLLKFSKSDHYVLGYSRRLDDNLALKLEVYYQKLFDIPVEDDITSSYSILNNSGGYTDRKLVNDGTGENYGVELTLERYFANNYFFMLTGSAYESTYIAKDGIERNGKFNGGYAGNFLFGKELLLGDKKDHKVLGFSTRVMLIGGHRYTPIDVDETIWAEYEVLQESNPYSLKGEDIFRWDVAFYLRLNFKKTTHEIKFDIQNITNHQAVVDEYYSFNLNKIEKINQLAILPVFMYKIDF